MKKRFIAFIFIGLIFAGLILAGIALAADSPSPTAPSDANKQNTTNVTLNINPDTLLSNELPSYLQAPTKLIFGLKADEKMDVSSFIVAISLFVFMLLFIHAILKMLPFFGKGWTSIAGGIVITLLISITGAIKDASEWLFGLGAFVKGYGFLKIIGTVIILAVIFFGANKLLRIVADKADVEQAESLAFKSSLKSMPLEGMLKMKKRYE